MQDTVSELRDRVDSDDEVVVTPQDPEIQYAKYIEVRWRLGRVAAPRCGHVG